MERSRFGMGMTGGGADGPGGGTPDIDVGAAARDPPGSIKVRPGRDMMYPRRWCSSINWW